MLRGPFARRRGGGIEVALTEPEVALLRAVVREMEAVLEAPERSPFTVRLFPPAYPDDPEAQAEYRRLVGEELVEGKRRALRSVAAALERGTVRRGGWRVALEEEEAGDLLAVLNDARLTLGTRLGVTEESHEREIDPADPDALAHEAFRYLGWLEEHLVETLAG
jgi:hypothetical protein